MARYQERFQGKKQVFLIRNGEAADAPAVMRYMSQVNRETTFLSMEAGEFEKVFSLEKETQLLAEWAPSQYHLSLLAQTEAGEIAASCNCSYSTERRRYRHRASLGPSPCARITGGRAWGGGCWRFRRGGAAARASPSCAWRWTPATPQPWGYTCEWDLRWREPSAGRSTWRTALIGTCISWLSFWMNKAKRLRPWKTGTAAFSSLGNVSMFPSMPPGRRAAPPRRLRWHLGTHPPREAIFD